MKKYLAAAAFMLLAFPATAMADPSIKLEKSYDMDLSWVDGTNLLKAGGSNGKYLTDMELNALSEDGFSSFYCFRDNIEAQKYYDGENNNVTGLYSRTGTELIPCKYGKIDQLNSHWALGITYKESDANNFDAEINIYVFGGDDKHLYMLYDTIDVYHLDGESAQLVGTMTRDNYLDASAQGDYISIQDRATGAITLYDGSFNVLAENLSSLYDDAGYDLEDYYTYSENGQQGIKDQDGNVIVTPQFRWVETIYGDYAEVSTGELKGLVSLQNEVIVPAEYEDIVTNYEGVDTSYVSAGYVGVVKDGKFGYVDMQGNVTMEPKYSKDILDIHGASALLTDLEGNVHILAADGTDTILPEEYKDVRSLYYTNGLLYRFNTPDYEYGLIDWHGNVLIDSGAGSISASGDGSWLLAQPDYYHTDIYAIDYGTGSPAAEPAQEAVAEAQTEAAAEQPAQTEAAAAEQTEAAAEQPAQTEAAAAEQTEAAAEQPAQTEAAAAEQTEAAAEQAPAEGGSEDAGVINTVKSLLESAKQLAQTDPAATKDAIKTLLDNAVTMLGSQSESASSVLKSIMTLLDSGAADTSTITTLLDSAMAVLG